MTVAQKQQLRRLLDIGMARAFKSSDRLNDLLAKYLGESLEEIGKGSNLATSRTNVIEYFDSFDRLDDLARIAWWKSPRTAELEEAVRMPEHGGPQGELIDLKPILDQAPANSFAIAGKIYAELAQDRASLPHTQNVALPPLDYAVQVAGLNRGEKDTWPLFRFAAEFAREIAKAEGGKTLADEIRKWLEGAIDRAKDPPADKARWRDLLKQPPAPPPAAAGQDPSLAIKVTPVAGTSRKSAASRFTILARLRGTRDARMLELKPRRVPRKTGLTPRPRSEPALPSFEKKDLGAAIGLLVQQLETTSVPPKDILVEVMLPQELLREAVDQWQVSLYGIPNPLGVHFPLVLRSLERPATPLRSRASVLSRQGAQCLVTDKLPYKVSDKAALLAYWIECNGQCEPGKLAAQMADSERVICCVLDGQSAPDERVLTAAYYAGVPIIVWVRQWPGQKSAAQARKQLRQLIDKRAVTALTAQVHSQRIRAVGAGAAWSLGSNLSVLWDDPARRSVDDDEDLQYAPPPTQPESPN